jgi:hypothetical protein
MLPAELAFYSASSEHSCVCFISETLKPAEHAWVASYQIYSGIQLKPYSLCCIQLKLGTVFFRPVEDNSMCYGKVKPLLLQIEDVSDKIDAAVEPVIEALEKDFKPNPTSSTGPDAKE